MKAYTTAADVHAEPCTHRASYLALFARGVTLGDVRAEARTEVAGALARRAEGVTAGDVDAEPRPWVAANLAIAADGVRPDWNAYAVAFRTLLDDPVNDAPDYGETIEEEAERLTGGGA